MMITDILGIGKFFWKLIILLVAGIYKVVGYCYQIFLVLARTNIFSQEQYQQLTDKIYVILGVLMMFVIAYNILTFIVDPDKDKGGSSVEKLLKNIITSFILIVLCPTLFNFAFRIQDAILQQGIFSKFFDNTSGFDGETSIKMGGNIMAGYVFDAFFNAENADASQNADAGITSEDECRPIYTVKCTLEEAKLAVKGEGNTKDGAGKFSVFKAFAGNLVDDDPKNQIDFNWFLSLIAGGYLVYVIISFCFDMAVRVVKLAFYQIIAPICIACRIIPNKESVFTNWWKAVTKTFVSVFVRVFIMNLGVYLTTIFVHSDFLKNACEPGECSWGVNLIAKALIILGIVTFIKQASKLIDEIFGLGDVKLGIREKMAEGGLFTAGALAGAGATSLVRNAKHAGSNIKKTWKETKGASGGKKFAARSAAILRGIGSTASGGVMGAYRGGKAGWKAASGADMQKAASTGARETTERRDQREAYRASHDLGRLKGSTPFIGGIASMAGHAADAGYSVARWAGFNNIEELEADNKSIKAMTDDVSAVTDQAKKLLLDKAMAGKTWAFGVNAKGKNYYKQAKVKETDLDEFGFTLSNIKLLQDKIEESKRTGQSVEVKGLTKTGVKLSAEQLNSIFGKYMSDYSKILADVAFKGEKNFENTFFDKDTGLRKVSEDEWKAISGIREAAQKARVTMRNSAGSATVKAANEEALRVAIIKKLEEENLITVDEFGTVQNFSDQAKARYEQLTHDQTIIQKAHLLSVEALRDQNDLFVTNDAAIDKIGSAGGSIISANQQKINQIRDREEKSGDKK